MGFATRKGPSGAIHWVLARGGAEWRRRSPTRENVSAPDSEIRARNAQAPLENPVYGCLRLSSRKAEICRSIVPGNGLAWTPVDPFGVHGKEGVVGSNPTEGSRKTRWKRRVFSFSGAVGGQRAGATGQVALGVMPRIMLRNRRVR